MSSKGDRTATILFILALVPLAAVGWTQAQSRKQAKAVESLRREVSTQQKKVADLNERLQVVESHRPLLAQLQDALVKPEGGSPYAQILLLTEDVRRQAGARFPSYAFGSPGAAGTLPRYSITGIATGSELQLLAFLKGLEEGQHRVQVTSITWQANGVQVLAGAPAAVGQSSGAPPVSSGDVMATVTLVYTGAPLASAAK